MEPSSAPSPKKEIIVLGAGVIGLTTALKIQLQGVYNVTIIAETLPSDPQSIRYTSSWAGAHHVFNHTDDALQHELEEMTFEVMWALSTSGNEAEECFLRIPQTEYFFDHNFPEPSPLEAMPNFKRLEESELIPGAKSGVSFTTVTIDVPIYLNYLFSRFVANGGKLIRGSVQHINQIIEGGASLFAGGTGSKPPDAVVVCVGLGARFLGGVEDKDVYPIRGQTVIVRAPWVRFGRTISLDDKGAVTYIIPRRSSDVVVGGTRVPNDWFPKPRPETTRDILERGFALCPELAPPDVRAEREPTIDDVLHHVVGQGCGLRPARKGGIRLEIDWAEGVGGRGRVPLIYNYGHGGYGYQTSWGAAVKALQLLEQGLSAAENSKSNVY